jgi:hypothetical protein
MAKRGVDNYLASAQDSYHLANERAKKLTNEDSNRMRGLKKSTLNKFISSAKDFANAAKISESGGYNEDASDYFLMASESANKALEINSKDSIRNLISLYDSKSAHLEKQIGGEGNLEQTILSITLVASFIFGIDLLSHKFTGNVIGSGNMPVDLSVGLLLLIASLIGIFFLLKNKNPKPIPHPERKKK